ncbi:MAG TPA: hypothetical protein VGA47_11780 [Candidatus Dormibacteraeota bacterium]
MKRSWIRFPLWLSLVLAAVSLVLTDSTGSAGTGSSLRSSADPAPVASLEPAATARLWRRLVASRSSRADVEGVCRPVRAVFYAETDFLRLATKLAANASPCAEYYISIPPIVADKTEPRRNQAWRIRALGTNFHAMAEIHFASWSRWVTSTGSTWYLAGTTARERMAAAGYDVSKGDTWALNEVSSAVRRGTGNARANLREFLRGLYEGDRSQPTRGTVFVIGVGQGATDVSLYQINLQSWFTDTEFWADVATYVSDWSQEVYGDVRNWAVSGIPRGLRRDYLNDFLQHQVVLANAGPETIETARSYLQEAYSPLANATWERETGYGWTMVPAEQMAGYVSAQVHALRYFGTKTGQSVDHWGFAWAPRNASGASASDFTAQSGLILDRLGLAMFDSGRSIDPMDPGSAACGTRENLWCSGDVEGATLNEEWKSFRVWMQPLLAFGTQPQTIAAGARSEPMALAFTTTTGLALTTRAPLPVTLSSSSPGGTFSTSPVGPWSTSLSLVIAAGTGTSGVIYYLDTHAGSHVLTASAEAVTSGTQTVTITPGPAVALTVTPASATVRARATRRFAAKGTDSYGNAFPVSAEWSLTPPTIGTIAPSTGSTTTFRAKSRPADGTLTAAITTQAGTITGVATLQVARARLRIVSITYRRGNGATRVNVTARDEAGRPVPRAVVSVVVRLDDRVHYAARARTGAAGRAVFRVPMRAGGCLTTAVKGVFAAGYLWDGRNPSNRYCAPPRS